MAWDVHTAWNMSKYGVFSGPYFPVSEPEKTLYLHTFHAVVLFEQRNFIHKFYIVLT